MKTILNSGSLRVTLVVPLLASICCSGASVDAQAKAAFVRQIPWVGQGVWLRADTHVHTTFSDGSGSVEQVVARAEQNGLDVIAITDHLDRNLKGATPEYFAAIDAARHAHPKMVIMAGAEWNIPPSGGDDHVVVLVPAEAERTLTEFKTLFDDLDPDGKPSPTLRPLHDPRLAADGLRWLKDHASRGDLLPVVMYEHPSRKNDRSAEAAAIVSGWRGVNDLVVGLAGAPGHQGKPPIGGYKGKEVSIDRWDPVAARIGDAWDMLLRKGDDVWGAYAPSDFHNDSPNDLGDFWPGQFAATWLYAPDRSQSGVLRALRAGSFFAEHGQIAQDVELNVSAPGLTRDAVAGEVVRVPAGTPVGVTMRFSAPAATIDQVEVIAIDTTGARIALSDHPADGQVTYSGSVPKGGIVFRGRGYHNLPDGTRVAFYTNPVRVMTN